MKRLASFIACTVAFSASAALAETLWIEGEKPASASVARHPWWYDQVKRDQLSGGDMISNWNDKKPGEVEYRVTAAEAGPHAFWVRGNPTATKLSYAINGGPWVLIEWQKQGEVANIAADGKIDVRFICWTKAGAVDLKKGANTVRFKMHSENNNHGMIDCFVLSTEDFRPQGVLRPNEIAEHNRRVAEENKGWQPFAPPQDPFKDSPIDLRGLNEKVAGEGGFIGTRGSQFIHGESGEPVRFWAVNGPPGDMKDPQALRRTARFLAKYGVNLVRVHGAMCDEAGTVKPEAVERVHAVVEAMKAEGIYCHFSIYFPLWLRPKPGTPWLQGYNGEQHPFAALYFNKDFQAHYRTWLEALLKTPDAKTGKKLIDDPAVMGVEIINEDSYFFWTFDAKNIPDPQLRIVETQFAQWLVKKYGSLDKALAAWNGLRTPRDKPDEGRMGFRPLWNAFTEKTARDKDAARFLFESQRRFYRETYDYIRTLGFKGVITASNWTTANNEVFGPLEKASYDVCDFIDRHGYFGCKQDGDQAGWSVRDGHTYFDRCGYKFEPEDPGKPKLFAHPAMDPSYENKPSMISETTWCRPNRFRGEAPLFFAVYGALQDSDAIVHFAFDGPTWSVKPNYFMQPWTLMTPAMMGQFPAAALIFRKGLVAPGAPMVDLNLKAADILELKGTPMPQDAALDELRMKDIPQGMALKPGNLIDPLVHLVGRTNVRFTATGGPAKLRDTRPFIDRKAQTVAASTGELKLDYGRGVLRIDAAAAQGVGGMLRDAGAVELKDVAIQSPMELGFIVAVSLDGQPLASSKKILLQAMSEEKAAGFETEPAGNGLKRIRSIGHDPWLFRELQGTVKFKRADAGKFTVTALDLNGYPVEKAGTADEITLRPAAVYYVIE